MTKLLFRQNKKLISASCAAQLSAILSQRETAVCNTHCVYTQHTHFHPVDISPVSLFQWISTRLSLWRRLSIKKFFLKNVENKRLALQCHHGRERERERAFALQKAKDIHAGWFLVTCSIQSYSKYSSRLTSFAHTLVCLQTHAHYQSKTLLLLRTSSK